MDELIIKDDDLRIPDHWPVEVALGLYEDGTPGFLNILATASKGSGYAFNDAGVTFWDDLDDYEKTNESPFEVECFVLDEACRLTYAEFGFYLSLACDRYGTRFPGKRSEAEALVNTYRRRFLD